MDKIFDKKFTGERALFRARELEIVRSVFEDGESPLKESREITVTDSVFKWKYPMWYSENVAASNTTFLVTARSGIWYTNNVSLTDCTVDAPKTFRSCNGVRVCGCTFPNAAETLWRCSNVEIRNAAFVGDYLGLGAVGVRAENMSLSGNYAFDGGRDIEISSSRLISKDAFWNCENVTVRDSVVIGEYIGWNSKNLRFINCTVESNQGFCYINGLVLENCRLINTDLAFERCSDVDVTVTTVIDSIKNPISGTIRAKGIGQIILDESDPELVTILCEEDQ
jgi:hypothetical protein